MSHWARALHSERKASNCPLGQRRGTVSACSQSLTCAITLKNPLGLKRVHAARPGGNAPTKRAPLPFPSAPEGTRGLCKRQGEPVDEVEENEYPLRHKAYSCNTRRTHTEKRKHPNVADENGNTNGSERYHEPARTPSLRAGVARRRRIKKKGKAPVGNVDPSARWLRQELFDGSSARMSCHWRAGFELRAECGVNPPGEELSAGRA